MNIHYFKHVQDTLLQKFPDIVTDIVMTKLTQDYTDKTLFSFILSKLCSKHANIDTNYDKVQALKQIGYRIGGKYKIFVDLLISQAIQSRFIKDINKPKNIRIHNPYDEYENDEYENDEYETEEILTEESFSIERQKDFYMYLESFEDYPCFVEDFEMVYNISFFKYPMNNQIPKKAYDSYIQLCIKDSFENYYDDRLINVHLDTEVIDEETGKIYSYWDLQNSWFGKKELK